MHVELCRAQEEREKEKIRRVINMLFIWQQIIDALWMVFGMNFDAIMHCFDKGECERENWFEQ